MLSAVVVAAQPDSGTFVASLTNNSTDEDAELTGVAGAGEWSDLAFDPSDRDRDPRPRVRQPRSTRPASP